MILWVLDYGSARVIKMYIDIKIYQEFTKHEDAIDNLLTSIGCNGELCEWMITEKNVELEIFS